MTRPALLVEELDLGIVGGWAAKERVGGRKAAEVQVEEGCDVGALGGNSAVWLDRADDFGNARVCQLARQDSGSEQLAEELLQVGVAVVLGVAEGEKETPALEV